MATAKELLKKVSTEKKKLTCERREKLISAVFENKVIWDKCLSEHKDNASVDAAWNIISLTTGMSKALAKREWKYLRDQFRTNFNVVNVKKSGSGYDPEKDFDKIKWPYFKQMLFLKDIISKRETSCNIDEMNESETVEEMSHQNSNDAEAYKILSSMSEGTVGDKEIVEEVAEPSELSTQSTSRCTSSASSSRPSSAANSTNTQGKRKATKRSVGTNDDILEEMDKIDKVMMKVAESANSHSSDDAADRFGKYIADIFRRVKTKKQPKFELKLIQTAFSFLSDSDSE